MRKLILFLVLFLVSVSATLSQDLQDLPKLISNPDFLTTNKDLDSVVRYTFNSPGDSSLFAKWAYDKNGNQISWTQSYYLLGRKWDVYEVHENVYDSYSN